MDVPGSFFFREICGRATMYDGEDEGAMQADDPIAGEHLLGPLPLGTSSPHEASRPGKRYLRQSCLSRAVTDWIGIHVNK